MATKRVLVTLGKRKRAVSFISDTSNKPDRDTLRKRIKEKFNDCLDLEGCDADSLLLQVKSEEWPDEWVDLRAQDEIEDRILVKAEKLEVRYVKISGQ